MTVQWRSAAFLLLLMCVPLGASQAPSQPPPVFRSGTKLTVVDVTVTDKQGKPIEGLTAADFIVTEDGEPQTISQVAFQRVETSDAPLPPVATPPPPRAASVAPTVQPTITGSAAGSIRYKDRRLIVLYFDLSSMPPQDQVRAFTAARKYLAEQIKPQDLVAILTFDNGAVRVKTDLRAIERRSRK